MWLYKRGDRWWVKFRVNGQLFQKPAISPFTHKATTDKREAYSLLPQILADVQQGKLTCRTGTIPKFFQAATKYLESIAASAAAGTIRVERERITILRRELGDVTLRSITSAVIQAFQQRRLAAGISPRTVNMDVGTLSRILKRNKLWRRIEDDVKFLSEKTGPPVGRALTDEEHERLFALACTKPGWFNAYTAGVVSSNTSMRWVEVRHIRRSNVDLAEGVVEVAKSKNLTSHRRLPLNPDALGAVRTMMQRSDKLSLDPDSYLWCACEHLHFDPTKPQTSVRTAWRSLTKAAGLPGLRFHDLRHTAVTRLLEAGIPDHVVQSITGHLSKRMLEHYSHTRIQAKRSAVAALATVPGNVPQPASDPRSSQQLQTATKLTDSAATATARVS